MTSCQQRQNQNNAKQLPNNRPSQTRRTIHRRRNIVHTGLPGSKVTKDRNTEAEIKTRINKARRAFAALKNIWKTKMISKKTKIRIFKSYVGLLSLLCCRVFESD